VALRYLTPVAFNFWYLQGGVKMKEKSENQSDNINPDKNKKTILILSANPSTTRRLRFDREISDSEESILRSKYRHQFNIQSRLAVGFREIRRAPLDHTPDIVHFIGHGTKKGLMVEGGMGAAESVSSEVISDLFELFSDHVKCVILSACYSEPQADAISQHIDYVIGIRSKIKGEAAIAFAVGFYDALGASRTVEDAFKFGRNAIQQKFPKLPEHLLPVLKKRKDIINQDSGKEEKESKNENEQDSTNLVFKTIKIILKILKKEILEISIKKYYSIKIQLFLTIPIALLFIVLIIIIGQFNNKLPKITMVCIPEGNFLKGTSDTEIRELLNDHPDWRHEMFRDETPQKEIYLDAFYISKYEITNKQYGKFLKDNPQHPRPGNWNMKNFNDPDQPVVGVSWNDAVAFCNWLSKKTAKNYRLPSEAQWEKAARGTDGGMFPWGDSGPNIQIANYNNPYGNPMPVGYYPRGENLVYGTMEMAGNVAEWCNDWYDERYYIKLENTENPRGPLTGSKKIVRGGSWIDNAFFLRCTARNCYPPGTRREIIGFRIVRIPGN
jgi:formylglycine-generating enzyme required for sulfatase activity